MPSSLKQRLDNLEQAAATCQRRDPGPNDDPEFRAWLSTSEADEFFEDIDSIRLLHSVPPTPKDDPQVMAFMTRIHAKFERRAR